jgi:phosphatidylglycerol---prolipoprotein diacylglyceryl transferase
MTGTGSLLSWNADPTLWHLGPLVLRWYGVCFGVGVLLAYQLGRRVLEPDGVTRRQTDRLLGYITVGTLVGARLGHCLLYEPGFYLTHPLQILFIWRGGLASHGGVVGILLATWLFARRMGWRYLWLADRIALVAPVAAACIRVGNFFNSEIVGRPSTVPWAVTFLRVDGQPRHPAQLYEAVFYLVTQVIVLALYRRTSVAKRPGALLGIVLVMIFSFRFLVEFLKEPQTPFEARLWLDLGQLLSIPAIAAGAILLWQSLRRKAVAGRQRTGTSAA